jgi:hypothetical protein
LGIHIMVGKAKDLTWLIVGAALLLGGSFLYGQSSGKADTPDLKSGGKGLKLKPDATSWKCNALPVPDWSGVRPISAYESWEVAPAYRNPDFIYRGNHGYEYYRTPTWYNWDGWLTIPYTSKERCYEVVYL